MTEYMQASRTQSRQAVIVRYCLNLIEICIHPVAISLLKTQLKQTAAIAKQFRGSVERFFPLPIQKRNPPQGSGGICPKAWNVCQSPKRIITIESGTSGIGYKKLHYRYHARTPTV